MKFTNTISAALVVIPSVLLVSATLNHRQNDKGGGANNDNGDPQKSLTLDPKVIASGFANDGQDQPEEGQVPSLTSTNNFINFCLLSPNVPITNGQQITTGSCNPAPIGLIPSVDKMPSAKFTNPKNGDTIPSSAAFTISMAIKNLQTGSFVNAQKNYFAAPQQLNGGGTIIGHSHVVIETLTSLTQTTATDPTKFLFFKGLNAVAANGVLTADVTSGVPPGAYRLCSINSSSNHQPAIVPVAQHGSLDDCIYFTATVGGAKADDGTANGGKDTGAGDGANNAAGDGGNKGADNGAGNGADNGAADGADKGAANGADKGAANGADKGAANGADNGAANGSDKGADNGAGNGAANLAANSTDNAAGANGGANPGTGNGANAKNAPAGANKGGKGGAGRGKKGRGGQ